MEEERKLRKRKASLPVNNFFLKSCCFKRETSSIKTSLQRDIKIVLMISYLTTTALFDG